MTNIAFLITIEESHGLGHLFRQINQINIIKEYKDIDLTIYLYSTKECNANLKEILPKKLNIIYVSDLNNFYPSKNINSLIVDIKDRNILGKFLIKFKSISQSKVIVYDDDPRNFPFIEFVEYLVDANLKLLEFNDINIKIGSCKDKVLIGPGYANNFICKDKIEISKKFSFDLVIYFGSNDSKKIIHRLIDSDFFDYNKNLKTLIVTGKYNNDQNNIQKKLAKYQNITIINHTNEWFFYLKNSNILLTNYGTSFWDGCIFKNTIIAISTEYDQIESSMVMRNLKIAYDLGWHAFLDISELNKIIQNSNKKSLVIYRNLEEFIKKCTIINDDFISYLKD